MSIRSQKTFSSRRAYLWLAVLVGSLIIAAGAGTRQQASGIWNFTPQNVYLTDIQVPFWRNFTFDTMSIGTWQAPGGPPRWQQALRFEYQMGTVHIPSHGQDRVADFDAYVKELQDRLARVRNDGESNLLVRIHWTSLVTAVALFVALLGMIGFLRQLLRPRASQPG